MQENSVVATLHHQIVYRIQDHALDLVLPSSDEALFLEVSSASQAPSSIQIPRQISREELLKKLPESWVTSYEKLHQSANAPIQSAEVSFHPKSDGTTEIKFAPPRTSTAKNPLFTQFTIELPEFEGPYREQIPKPISFFQNGATLWPFKDENGHKYFDIDCDCPGCLEDEYESEDEIRQRRRMKKDPLYKRYLEGDPTVGPLGEETGRYEYIVSYGDKNQTEPTPELMMFSPSDFPPLSDFNKSGVEHSSKIVTTAVNPSGPERLSQGEKVLNWQTENALAQNRMLTTINGKIDQLAIENKRRNLTLQESIKEIHEKLGTLHIELLSMAKNMLVNTSTFRSKEAEMKNLKNQLRDLQAVQQRRSTDPFGTTLFGSIPSWCQNQQPSQQGFLSGDSGQQSSLPQHGFLSGDEIYTSRYAMPSLPEFQPKTQRSKKYKAPETSNQPSKKPSLSSSSSQNSQDHNQKQEADPKDKDIGVIEFSMTNLLDTLAEQVQNQPQNQAKISPQSSEPTQIPNISHLSEDSSTDFSDDTSEAAKSENEDTKTEPLQFAVGENSHQYKEEPVYSSTEEMEYQATGGREETIKPTKTYASKVLVFTFDDIPFSKWNSRIDEFHAWMTSEALTTPTDQVIQQFTARLSGALKEWWTSLGDYRQLLVLQATIPALLGEIHREFIGTPNLLKDQIREEFFKAKCCSMNRKDLAKHFERQTKRYYALDGLNNPSLKHIYLASIDEYLGQQTIAYIKDQGTTVEEISIGQIQQSVFKTLDKLCKQKEFWSEFVDKTKTISKVCARPDLYIKCSKSKGSCSCKTKKKKHHRRIKEDRRNKFVKFRRKRFFRRKRGFKKSTRCFLCRKEGHYAKNCPNKSKQKKQYLVHSIAKFAPELDLEHHDLESVLSYDSDDNDALCGYSDSEEEFSDTSSMSSDECYKITQYPEPDPQTPHLPVTIFDPDDNVPAIHAIAFIDTGAHTSIMNPKTLPENMWLPYQQEFRVANASSLVIKLKSKPIIIEIFPGCKITTQVLGSSAPGKDLILGWDSYYKLKKKFDISIEPRGIRWKSHYKAFTSIPRLFTVESMSSSEIEEIRRNLTTNSCADSHKEFLLKCNSPLWLNPQFFVALPFKENIDTTPTKASHAGMSPALLQQANEECDQLMKQGLVTATNSPWACKAFYVNNRAEQLRGKLRLVIDYKPLNKFLQDIKFPLPTRRSLLQSLSGAKVFSKFDLKSGFWQLGIQPEEQYKTAFCLPNRHLQWRVLPFGLKTAPSLFQQAMLKIFKPILHTALIYIDDILLFSKEEAEHIQTLRQFQQIVQEYGIMLSARKMILAQPNIEFLGVQITEGQFAPQAHLATELLDFPEENLTKRQVQQFLGVINYLGDFIPNLSKLTQPLRKMLIKNPPPWKNRQT